jgi:transcriptional regulator with XRE-family HTH domain
MASQYRSKKEMTVLKKRAKKLLLEHRLTQKEIAAKLNISEKTMYHWVKRYSWKLTDELTLVSEAGNLTIQHLTGFVEVQGFADYLRQADPKCYQLALSHLSNYLYSLSLQ